MAYRLLFLWATLSCSACSLDESALCGNWKATAFYEAGQTKVVDLTPIQLTLTPDKKYEFTSQGFYREAGKWHTNINYLFLKDTTGAYTEERMLKVLYLSADSLKLKMNDKGTEQVLFLARK